MSPHGWTSVPFWSLYSRVKTLDHPNEELLSVYRDYGVIRKSDRDDNRNRPGEDMSKYQLVMPGDLVLNKMKTWQGSLGVSAYRGILSPAYFVYQPQSDNVGRFLHHALRSQQYIDYYAAISKGVRPDQWDLQPERLSQMMVLLPPTGQQQRIADFLDGELAEIDSMDAELDDLIERLNERRRAASTSAFATLFAGPTAPLWSVLVPVREQGWPNERVLSVYREYGVIPKDSRDDNGNQTPADLTSYQLVLPGDVVVNKMKAWQGSLGVSVHRGIVSPDYQVARPVGDVLPAYLHAVLRSPYMAPQYSVRSRGVRPGQWRLYWEDFAHIQIPLPDAPEQRRIVIDLNDATTRIDDMISDAQRLRTLLGERRSTLVTEVVTGRKEVA